MDEKSTGERCGDSLNRCQGTCKCPVAGASIVCEREENCVWNQARGLSEKRKPGRGEYHWGQFGAGLGAAER